MRTSAKSRSHGHRSVEGTRQIHRVMTIRHKRMGSADVRTISCHCFGCVEAKIDPLRKESSYDDDVA